MAKLQNNDDLGRLIKDLVDKGYGVSKAEEKTNMLNIWNGEPDFVLGSILLYEESVEVTIADLGDSDMQRLFIAVVGKYAQPEKMY